jgi:hypothetical protein
MKPMIKMATTSAPSELSCNETSISSTPMAPFDSPTAKSYRAERRRPVVTLRVSLRIRSCELLVRSAARAWSTARMGLCSNP